VRDAAVIYRRSGVRVRLDPEEQRIFDAVVREQRDGADLEAELERVRSEIARAERMLADERFATGAPEEVVEAERDKLARYQRELDALTD
jgi:valyl-tRNA synthetase